MRIIAIVLAAGEGRRMGGPKALARIGEKTFLARVCLTLAGAGADATVAVVGAEAERVRCEAGVPEGTVVVRNDGWRDGMLSSVLRGLDEAERLEADAVLVHPVDTPLVSVETAQRVVRGLREGHSIVLPTHGERRGHPAGFARAVFAELRAAPLSEGARAILARFPERILHVEGDAGCVAGIDTPEDYRRLLGAAQG